jgi:hypothetical protein
VSISHPSFSRTPRVPSLYKTDLFTCHNGVMEDLPRAAPSVIAYGHIIYPQRFPGAPFKSGRGPTYHMTVADHKHALCELVYPTLLLELALVRNADQPFFACESFECLPTIRDLQKVHTVSPGIVLRQCWLFDRWRQRPNDWSYLNARRALDAKYSPWTRSSPKRIKSGSIVLNALRKENN